MKKMMSVTVALLVGICTVAWAQQKGPAAGKDVFAKDPSADAQQQMYDKPLPEIKGVLSWKTLGEVKPDRKSTRLNSSH